MAEEQAGELVEGSHYALKEEYHDTPLPREVEFLEDFFSADGVHLVSARKESGGLMQFGYYTFLSLYERML